MRLDGEAASVAIIFERGENLADFALTITGKSVFLGLGFTGGGIGAVLDVNVHDVFFDLVVKLKWILPGERLGLCAIELENGICGVKDEFQPGNLLYKP